MDHTPTHACVCATIFVRTLVGIMPQFVSETLSLVVTKQHVHKQTNTFCTSMFVRTHFLSLTITTKSLTDISNLYLKTWWKPSFCEDQVECVHFPNIKYILWSSLYSMNKNTYTHTFCFYLSVGFHRLGSLLMLYPAFCPHPDHHNKMSDPYQTQF